MGDSNRRKEEKKQSGMAWGASASSSRKRKANGMGDFGRYMSEKQHKLRTQFQGDASRNTVSASAGDAAVHDSHSTLFQGISIFVNGYTIPSHQELRNMMIQYGGRFENYFSRDRVTHIICSVLPGSKIKDPRSFSRGLPIIKPNWVVDSIAEGKILPLSSYYLECLASPNQSTLSNFLVSRDYSKTSAKLQGSDCLTLQDADYMVRQDECKISEISEEKPNCELEEPFGLDDVKSNESSIDLDKGNSHILHFQDMKDVGEMDLSNDVLEQDVLGLSIEPPMQPFREGNSLDGGKKDFMMQQSALQTRIRTLGDSNFVQNFFKNSRLHFIGTWRTRYCKKLASRLHEEEDKSKSDSLSSKASTSNNSTIMHIDMDCFFVSVVVKNMPELRGKPVAVCHSDNALGTAEISSANYPARGFGVKAGMFVRDAKRLCPDLEIVPYDFEGYEKVADQFYDILHKHCTRVQAISCDEAYLDVSGLGDPKCMGSIVKKEIFDATQCTASVGIADNLLLARIATRRAKPDGLYHIEPGQVDDFILDVSIEDLPGVGWSMQEKLHKEKIFNCKQLQAVSKRVLQREFGSRTGEMLWSYARGIDNRQIQINQERKSIGAEVNWGVRFKCQNDAQHFLFNLCEEVGGRLRNAAICGRTFTLKIKKRKEGAGEPEKYMGCGSCNNVSKSATVAYATDEIDVILRVTKRLFASLHLDVHEIRGIGLQVTKLEPSVINGQGQVSVPGYSGLARKEHKLSWSLGKVLKGPFSRQKQQGSGKDTEKEKTILRQSLPPLSELDHSVLAFLPPEILEEVNAAYNGAIVKCLSATSDPVYEVDSYHEKNKLIDMRSLYQHSNASPSSRCSNENFILAASKENTDSFLEKEVTGEGKEQIPPSKVTNSVEAGSMSTSLMQMDVAALSKFPSQVLQGIVTLHQRELQSDFKLIACKDSCTGQASLLQTKNGKEISQGGELVDFADLWLGSPPKWISLNKNIQGKGSAWLSLMADCYLNGSSVQNFSSVLLRLISYHPEEPSLDVTESDEPVLYCASFFKQYFQIKVANNIEEVYMVLRFLKRLTSISQFWVVVYGLLLPNVQDIVLKNYGGMLVLQ